MGPRQIKYVTNDKKNTTRSFIVYTLHLLLLWRSRMRWAGHAAYIGNTSSTCKILLGRQENRPLGRPLHRWKENIKTDLRKNGMKLQTELNWHNGSYSKLLIHHDEPSSSTKCRYLLIA
jgi:hypothetical protein